MNRRQRGASERLKRLQIFNQIFPLVIPQRASHDAWFARTRSLERMAERAVAVQRAGFRRREQGFGFRRREKGFALVAFRRFAGDHAIADLLGVEVAGADAESLRM